MAFEKEEEWGWKRWALAALALFIIAGTAYWILFGLAKDYVIPGVPIYGTFSGTVLWQDGESAAAMLLGYWGDERLLFTEIRRNFTKKYAQFGMSDLADFFIGQGYRAEIVTLTDSKDLRRYINNDASIPVIIFMDRDLGEVKTKTFAVVIGILNNGQQLMIHHTDFGSNFVISSEAAGFPGPVDVLVVQPGNEIKSLIKGPNHSRAYLPRLKVMDDPDIQEILQKSALAYEVFYRPQSEENNRKLLALWQEIINHPGFEKLSPAGRMYSYNAMAYQLVILKQCQEAIGVINENVLPRNHDLNQPYGEWRPGPYMVSAFAYPWRTLSFAFKCTGDVKRAEEALRKAGEVDEERLRLEKLGKELLSR